MAYLAAKNATVTVASAALKFQTFKLTQAVSKFDATNIAGLTNGAGLLSEEMGVDTVTTTFTGSFVVDGAGIQVVLAGRIVVVAYAGPDGVSHSGNAYILNVGKPAAAKGGFLVEISGEFSGVVSGQ